MNNKNNIISISEVFWSVPNLKFADDILSSALTIKKIKPDAEYFSTYQLPNNTKIIAFVEKDQDFKIYDTCLRLFVPKEKILSAYQIIKDKYQCHFNDSKTTILHCFAPSPNKWCEIIIND